MQKNPRKHRDILSNGVLNEAVEALEEFKDVEWPPHRTEMESILSAIPDWMVRSCSTTTSTVSDSSSGRSKDEDNIVIEKELAQDLEQKVSISLSPSSATVDTALGNDCIMESVDVNDDDDEVEEAKELHQKMFPTKSSADENNNSVHEEDTNNNSVGEEEEEKGGNSVAQEIIGLSSPTTAVEGEATNEVDEDKTNRRIEAIVDEERPMETPISPVISPINNNSNNNNTNRNSSSLNTVTTSSALPPPPTTTTTKVDAAAMEPMHPAVITTLHALCLVISSESKTPKMAEVALECITILTNGRYVSGIAGGRMKLEVQQQQQLSSKQGHALEETQSDDGQGQAVMAGSSANDRLHARAAATATTTKGHDGRDGGLSFLGYVIESITRASDSPSEAVQSAMAKALLSIMTCPKCGVHEAAMLQAVRSTFHVYLVGKSNSGKELAKRSLVDMLKCFFMRMEAYDIVSRKKNDTGDSTTMVANGVPTSATSDTVDTTTTTVNGSTTAAAAADASVGVFASQYHTDSYLLFRALCKLSSKTLPGDENVGPVTTSSMTGFGSSVVGSSAMSGSFFSNTPVVDPLALSSKILSLDLILAVFEHCGDAFKNGEKFVYAVQSYLCVSLLKNCMSNQTVVAHLSLKIFLLLVSKKHVQLNLHHHRQVEYICSHTICHLTHMLAIHRRFESSRHILNQKSKSSWQISSFAYSNHPTHHSSKRYWYLRPFEHSAPIHKC